MNKIVNRCYLQVPGAEGNFVFINDACYKKPDISKLPFPTYLAPEEDEDPSELEPLVADLGEVDPFMLAEWCRFHFFFFFNVCARQEAEDVESQSQS